MAKGTYLFDMDGLLVDSEPYWKLAEKEVFGALGLNLSDELLRQVMGFRLNEVVKHWYRYQPWPEPDFLRTENEIIEVMKSHLRQHAKALPGVYDTLEWVKKNNYPAAVASSSSMQLIQVVTDTLQIKDYFDLLYSAETEPYGKPHPGIFMSAAKMLGAAPEYCVVLEDSVNGVIAAKAARMTCVAVPEPEKLNDPRFSIADFIIPSLEEFPLLVQKIS